MSSGREQRLRYTELSPGAIAPMRSVEHYLNAQSGLERTLLELVRLAVSQRNGCAFCVGLHTHELRRQNEPESRITSVGAWRESDAYTERERAALGWAEAVSAAQGEVADEAYAAAREHFQEKEIVDLTVAIASISAWNRLGLAFLPQWDEAKATSGRVAADRRGGGAADGDEGKAAVDGDSA